MKQVSESRLALRNHRPDGELCRDPPFQKLVSEVGELKQSVKMLNQMVNNTVGDKIKYFLTQSAYNIITILVKYYIFVTFSISAK